MKDYIELSNGISWDNKLFVKNILLHNKDLDLLYKNGRFFKMAVESNHADIVAVLLEYFINNQLSKYDAESSKFCNLKKQLIEVFEVAIDEVDLIPEMKEILSPYIDFESSEGSRSILDDDQINDDYIIKDQINFTTLKKSYSANDLHTSTLTEENLKSLSNNPAEEKFKFIEEFLGEEEHHIYDQLSGGASADFTYDY